jgi:predicted Zn-dependent protease
MKKTFNIWGFRVKLAITGVLFVLLAFCLFACDKQATVREETLELTTYPFGDSDPVPHPESVIYPYFRFDGYSAQGEPQKWETVVLENEYIKVTVMPSVGGKIWGAVDKTTGKEFIYFNHVAKFRDVSLRGPWTSGGIEFNFGIYGHSPFTTSPVDYYTRKNDDGSVSCFLSAIDRIGRTWWQVEINLPRDKAYFTTSTTWNNTTPFPRPYYQWMNAGYKAADDLEFAYNGQYYIGHEGDVHPWPIDEKGRDISKYANNNFGGYKSYHVLGNYNDFYGAYYKDSGYGSVHYSPFNDKLGMKIWIWGLSRQGMIWEDLLTDTDGQYVELQSGRLYNQAAPGSSLTPFKQFPIEPYANDSWTEYWYPVEETGGIVKANEAGALNVTKDDNSLVLSFSPVQKIDDDIIVKFGGKEIFRKHLSLNVLQTWKETIQPENLTRFQNGLGLEIILGDNRLVYSEKPDDNHLSRPVMAPADFDQNSAYGLYMQGEQEMYMNHLDKATELLKQSLTLEPYAIHTLRDLAFIYFQRGNMAEADSCTRRILSVNTYDPDGNFLYGLISSQQGRSIDAIDGFKVAALSPAHRAAANICLAKEAAKKQNWAQICRDVACRVSTESHPCRDGECRVSTEVLQLQSVAHRKLGQNKEASNLLAQIAKSQPLNHYARFEKYQQTKSEKDKKEFLRYIRSELPHETFMEMAGWYESLGCHEEALALYAFAPEYPIAAYRSAHILFQQGDDNYKSKLAQAESLSIEMVFPFRAETLPALGWAVSQSNQWKNKYYLGILYAYLGQNNRASQLLEQCGNEPQSQTFYLARAQYRQGHSKEEDLLRAEQIEKSWRAGLALVQHYQDSKQYDKMFDKAKEYVTLYPAKDALGLKYATAMLLQKKYRECTEFLSHLNILPYEGSNEGRRVYREAWLLCARQNMESGDYSAALSDIEKSKLWPENLGVGKPYNEDIDLSVEDSLTAIIVAKKILYLCKEETASKNK